MAKTIELLPRALGAVPGKPRCQRCRATVRQEPGCFVCGCGIAFVLGVLGNGWVVPELPMEGGFPRGCP